MTPTLREADRLHPLHPYTDAATLGGEDGTHVIVRGEGVWLSDDRGRRLQEPHLRELVASAASA